MTSYNQTITEVESLHQSRIVVDPRRKLAPINPNIYSSFLEHLGRVIYGGIVDYNDPPSAPVNEQGFRTDVSKAIQDLNVPVVRWPGGNYVSSYHWQDGVGPTENRPRRPELAWNGEESNLFGTDEFIEWCRYHKVEPYICLNMGTGTLDEALAWVEYCNSNANTYYANLRRANGHTEPYNVKYWGLGNEVWGDWQVGQQTAEDYAKNADQWGKAIKLLDPNIVLVSCGKTGVDNWDYHVLNQLINRVDLHSIHIYTASDSYIKNVTAPAAAEAAIQVTKNLIDLATIQNSALANGKEKVKICFDEWNVWDPARADASKGLEEQYTLSDALAVASWLNVFVRQAETLAMCNLAQLVNAIAPIVTSDSDLFLQSIYYPIQLFSKYMRNGYALNLHVDSTLYTGETGNNDGSYTWIQGNLQVPLLDASAVQNNEDTKTYIAVVNRDENEDAFAKIAFTRKVRKIHQWHLYNDDVFAYNTIEKKETIALTEADLEFQQDENGNIEILFKKHSFTFLEVTYA